MTNEELIPCPLCGNISVVIESDGDLLYWGACHNNECDAIGPESHIRERAIKLWNTRPIEDALRAEVERLRAGIERIFVGGNSLASVLSGMNNTLPYQTPIEDAREYYIGKLNNINHYELWLCWREMMTVRDTLKGNG